MPYRTSEDAGLCQSSRRDDRLRRGPRTLRHGSALFQASLHAARACRRVWGAASRVEGLEPRRLLSGTSQNEWSTADLTCSCAVCKGVAMDIPMWDDVASGAGGEGGDDPMAGTVPLSAVPQLSSRPQATAKLYLHFIGEPAQAWGGYNVPATPAFSTDGDATTFSAGDLAAIDEIWARVAEKYSPFNIDVTTVNPGQFVDQQALKVVIGGNGSWFGSGSGVAYVNSFFNFRPNVVWVFPQLLSNNARMVGEIAAHEAGHAFGLYHQSTYSGTTKTNEYNPGTSAKAPVMGNSLSTSRGLWWLGPNANGSTSIQDDLTVLASSSNGFGYRVDDHGNTLATATSLTVVNGTAVAGGVIEQTSDIDTFSFTVPTSGQVTINGAVAQFGAMLDMSLELYNSSGTLVASAATTSLGETITTNLPAGSYFVMVKSAGNYGDIGQYTLTVSVPQGQPPAPPVAAVAGTYTVGEGGTVTLSASPSTGTGLVFAWDLDGDGVFGETGGGATRGNETGVSVTFNASGLDGPSVFNVTLRVTDSAGQVSTLLVPISITDVAPTVTVGGSTSGFEGSPITISFTATDPGGVHDPITSWLVNWGDGTTSTYGGSITSATKTYLDNGNYVVTVTAVNKDASSTVTRNLTIANVAPTLTVTTSVPGGGPPREGSPIQLNFSATDPGTDTVSQWVVEWGDGTTSTFAGTTSSALKTYADNGTYTIRLTATDEDGSYTTTTTLVVENVAPTLTLTASATRLEGTPITFAWSATDPATDTITQWVVEWGDGTTSTFAGTVTSASKTYADNGNYTVRLTATDEDGIYVHTLPISVANVAPTITLTGSANPKEGSPFALSWTGTDPGTDTITQWVVEWGDGTTSTYAGSVTSAVKTYADDGQYTIRVTSTDEDGSYQQTLGITVANVIPVITWNAPATVVAGGEYTVTFSAFDPGADTISSWLVEWGDGTSTLLPGTATTATRIYSAAGNYTVTLRATDEDGTYTVNRPVAVSAAPVAISLTGSAHPVEGSPFTVNFSASSAVAVTVTSWTITWGDGTTSTLPGSASSAVKTYADDGEYLVRVTAVVDGQSYQGELAVSVANVAPTLSLTASATRLEGTPITFNWSATEPGTDTITQWRLEWGDGTTSTFAGSVTSASKTYADNGNYTVRLTATDEDGSWVTTMTLAVADVPPTLHITAPNTVVAGSAYTIQFTATDPGQDTISLWQVLWGDGTTSTFAGTVSSATRVYAAAGNYTVTVRATNEDGQFSTTRAVAVTAAPVAVSITAPAGLKEGSPFSLGFSASSSVAVTVSSWSIDWGDGTTTIHEGNLTSAVKTYGDDGQYTVRVTAMVGGASYVGEQVLTVANVAPTIALTGGANPSEGSPFMLSWTAIDPGHDTISQWKVEWGDGTTSTFAGDVSSAVKLYADNGTYTVRVTATDEDGNWTQTLPVSVANVAPTLTLTVPPQIKEGTPFTLGFTATDPGNDTISQWRVEWGDGTTSTFAGSVSSAVKTYADDGSYTIRLTATDEDGSWVQTLPVSVANVAPTIALTLPPEIREGTPFSLGFTATDSGNDTIVLWRIEWGDGSTTTHAGTTTSVVKAYADDGQYNLRVTAIDEDGQWTVTRQVSVAAVPPTISLFAPAQSQAGQAYVITFSAANTGNDPILGWVVDWGDGTTESLPGSATSATRVWSTAGDRVIRVSAIDSDGMWTSSPSQVAVAGAPLPTVSAVAPSQTVAGWRMPLSLSYTDGLARAISRWEVSWDNGATWTRVTASPDLTVVAPSAGERVLSVRVTLADGAQAVSTRAVRVFAGSELVSVTTPSVAVAGGAVVVGFEGQGLAATDRTGWRVVWSDGLEQVLPANATMALRTLPAEGEYTVQAISLHPSGEAASVVAGIGSEVASPRLMVPSDLMVGTPATFGLSLNPDVASLLRGWVVEWGDGRVSQLSAADRSVTQTFDTSGVRAVVLTALFDHGHTVESLSSITVQAQPAVSDGTWTQTTRKTAQVKVKTKNVRSDASFAFVVPSGGVWPADLVASNGDEFTLVVHSPDAAIDASENGEWILQATWGGQTRTLGSVMADTGSGTLDLKTVSGSVVFPRATAVLPTGTVLPGAQIRATARVAANGTGQVNGTDVGFYLSADSDWGEGDALLATTGLRGRFVAGQGKNAAARLVLPAGTAPGTYHLLAVVDSAEALREPDEKDNVLSLGTVTVVAPTVDLTGSRFLQVQTNRQGHVSAVRLLLTNGGNSAASEVSVRVMLMDGEGNLSESPVAEASLGRATLSAGAQRALRLVPRGAVVPPGSTLVAVVSAQGQSPFATAPVSLAA